MIIARAVIITGLKRVAPASMAALKESLLSAKCSLANVITSTLLEVATPMLMMVPMSAGTLSEVRVRNSIQQIPANAPGSAVMMMNASVQD
jgi:hypothetical protein